MYSLFVLLLCKSVRRARSVVKTLQPVIGGGSEGDGTNCSVFQWHRYKALSRRNEAGMNVPDRQTALCISTVTWLYLLMGQIRLFVLWDGHCEAEQHNDL